MNHLSSSFDAEKYLCQQEKQDRDWSLTPQQAPTAAKRLGKRVQRRLKSAVRRIRHPKSGGDGVVSDGTSDGSSGDDEASDSGSEASAQTVVGQS